MIKLRSSKDSTVFS